MGEARLFCLGGGQKGSREQGTGGKASWFPGPKISFPSLYLLIPSLSFISLSLLPLNVEPLYCGWRVWGALKIRQRVRAEPGRRTYFGAFLAYICTF